MDKGVVVNATNLRWNKFPLGKLLGEELGIRVTVDNDVNVGTWGEHVLGAARGHDGTGSIGGTGLSGSTGKPRAIVESAPLATSASGGMKEKFGLSSRHSLAGDTSKSGASLPRSAKAERGKALLACNNETGSAISGGVLRRRPGSFGSTFGFGKSTRLAGVVRSSPYLAMGGYLGARRPRRGRCKADPGGAQPAGRAAHRPPTIGSLTVDPHCAPLPGAWQRRCTINRDCETRSSMISRPRSAKSEESCMSSVLPTRTRQSVAPPMGPPTALKRSTNRCLSGALFGLRCT